MTFRQKGYLSQTANLFINLKSNTMKTQYKDTYLQEISKF